MRNTDAQVAVVTGDRGFEICLRFCRTDIQAEGFRFLKRRFSKLAVN